MTKPFRPIEKVSDLANKAKTALTTKLGPPNPAVSQAALARAQDTLKRLDNSPVGKTPIGEALRGYIRRQLAKGEGLEELQQQLIAKARAEVDRRKQLVSGLQDMGRAFFSGGDKLRRLRLEVLQPARTGQLTTPQVWQRIDDIAYGRSAFPRGTSPSNSAASKPMFPILEAFERKFGNVYFAVNAKAEAAVVLGGGASLGVGGMRHSQAFFTATYSIGVGCTTDAQGGLEIAVSMQKPETARKITFEVAAGAGYGVAGELTLSFRPTLAPGLQSSPEKWKPAPDKTLFAPERQLLKNLKNTEYDGLIFDYSFDGASLNIGAGAGADFSTSIAFGDSMLLRP